jgi:glycosyltransferase involved in cell wall biosynthesis
LKVCFVSVEYPPSVIGGAGIYAECLCQGLAKLGHDVHVITPQFGFKRQEQIEKGVVVHRIPIIRKPFLWTLCFWLNLRVYFSALQKKLANFDVLHGNVNSDISLTRDIVRVPRVVTIHHLGRTTFEILNPSLLELFQNPSGEIGLASWIEKNTLDFDKVVTKRADKVITVSDFCRRELIAKYKIQPSKLSVIPNGVDPKNYIVTEKEKEEIRKSLCDSDDFLVLFVGRLERRKGLSLLLKAFKLVSLEIKSKLVIVGSGKQDPYRRLCESLHIASHVVFVGSVDSTKLRRIYGACDLYVSSAYLEGFGITILEAMASEKPVVAMKVGGIPEVIKDGVHGKLVSHRDCSELAKAILELARDRDLAKSIGRKNRIFVKKSYDWSNNVKMTDQVYKDLLDSS